MALKFLNKKGWHTGSLRNIENVWKAEQKRDAEGRKLEELRKQIHEERERSEFRQLQEQAGLVPKQERLDFLYDSGLGVGKGSSSDGFKALESSTKIETKTETDTSSSKQQPSAPGALFEDKPQSANDAWRKLHSDPLLLIRQREQEALSRIKNNPIQMAMIRKSVEAKKPKEEKRDGKDHKKRSKKNSKRGEHFSLGDQLDSKNSGSEGEGRKKRSHRDNRSYSEHLSRGRTDPKAEERIDSGSEGEGRKRRSHRGNRNYSEHSSRGRTDSKAEKQRDSDGEGEGEARKNRSHRDNRSYSERSSRGKTTEEQIDSGSEGEGRKRRSYRDNRNYVEHSSRGRTDSKAEVQNDSGSEGEGRKRSHRDNRSYREHSSGGRTDSKAEEQRRKNHPKTKHEKDSTEVIEEQMVHGHMPRSRQRQTSLKLSEEEKAARLREMQLDAEVHEEQRWKRLKKASEIDSLEASQEGSSRGRNFLDAAHKSVYGAEKGGSSTIEESVRRRKYFMQGSSAAGEGSAFRR